MTAWKWGAAWLALVVGAAGAQAQAQAQPETVAEAQRALRAAERRLPAARRALDRWTERELLPFGTADEFDSYRAAVRRANQAEWDVVQGRSRLERAQFCESNKEKCLETDRRIRRPNLETSEPVTSTGGEQFFQQGSSNIGDSLNSLPQLRATFAQDAAPNVTNVQELAVDEGDIVKQIGPYLLILQDGRVFVVDMAGGPGRDRLVLVERADVYRDAKEDAWYDELVVYGDRVLVTGYSYRLNASEIAVFKLGEDGRLTRDGVFQIRSNDYYSGENYSTRIVADKLVLYTPLAIRDEDGEKMDWPRLRQVPVRRPADGIEDKDNAERAFAAGSLLLTPGRLYRPLATLGDPTIHMITSCALGSDPAEAVPRCESQGYVASNSREFYVAGEQAYLWTYASDSDWSYAEQPRACTPGHPSSRTEAPPAIVYRLNLSGREAGVAGAAGVPFDQLGLDASGGRFRALLSWASDKCRHTKGVPLTYLNTPETVFSRRLRPLPDGAFTAMPDIGANMVENRFTDDYLVFGGRTQRSWWSDEPEQEGLIGSGEAVVVPIDRPQAAATVRLPHRVWRVERVGGNVLLTGYSDRQGLDMSVIDLRGPAPRLASSLQLEGRFESEGRSHAFNSLIRQDGSGLMGVPTVVSVGDSDRYRWRSTASDLSFLSLDAQGQLQPLGALEARSENGERWGYEKAETDDPNVYSCQVSCIDWYGNSRPLFTGGRVFALTATELIEGRVSGGRIGEVQRIDLTKAELPAHLRRAAAAAAGGDEE